MTSPIRGCLSIAAVWLLSAGAASAEIVLLKSGQTLSAKSHRLDGDRIVLTMRNGGEITCERDLVDKILPDEVPVQELAASAPPTVEGLPEAEPARRAPDGPFGEIIANLSAAHGVDPLLVEALIKVESNNRPRARSQKGAMGLMQLMPATARQYNVRNPYDPTANIAAGIQHLKSLLDRWKTVDLALAAYNAGEGAVRKFNGIPPYRETRNYVSRILELAGLR